MQKRVINIAFSGLFLLMIVIPLFMTNLKDNVISEAENRYLTGKAKLYNEDGTINSHFPTDFESWINDNLGFRSQMVMANARMQYHLFNVLSNNSDMYLGPNGELNYATDAMLSDYQHNNLYSQDYLDRYAKSMQAVSNYVESKGSKFYYFQCWDKHSIYPEQFPTSVVQHGDVSKTDMLVKTLVENTSVNVVSPKEELISAKKNYTTYSRWGDPSHWTRRGSIIGYNLLISRINDTEGTDYHVLSDDDYNIAYTDQGTTVFGGIHEPDLLEAFEFKNQSIANANEQLTVFADDPRSAFFVNPKALYGETILLIADSYFASYCLYDFAYEFQNVIIIHADHVEDLPTILEAYPSDYVVVERAERVDSSQAIINTAEKINYLNHALKTYTADDLYVDDESGKGNNSKCITVEPGHVQYGPYDSLGRGKYRVVVYGKNLSSLDEQCIYINPNAYFEVVPDRVRIGEKQIEYFLSFPDDVYTLELGIRNMKDETIVVESIEVFTTF